jgi:hypothetical protein
LNIIITNKSSRQVYGASNEKVLLEVVPHRVAARFYPESLIAVLEIDFDVKIIRSKICGRSKALNKWANPKALSLLLSEKITPKKKRKKTKVL